MVNFVFRLGLTGCVLGDSFQTGFGLRAEVETRVKQTLWRLIILLTMLAIIASLLLVSFRGWR